MKHNRKTCNGSGSPATSCVGCVSDKKRRSSKPLRVLWGNRWIYGKRPMEPNEEARRREIASLQRSRKPE